MLSKLKISQKIFMLCAIQCGLIFIVGWIGYSQMEKIGKEIIEITDDDIPLTRSLTLVTEHQLQQAILFERAVLKSVLAQQGFPGAKEKYDELVKKINKLTKKVELELKDIEVFIESVIPKLHHQTTVEEYEHILKDLIIVEEHYLALEKKILLTLETISSGDFENGIQLALSTEAEQDKLDKELVDILNEIQRFTLDAAETAKRDEQKGIKLILITLAASLVISLSLPFLIGKSITQPINNLNVRLREVSEGDGDLRIRLDESARDETGDAARSLNKFLEKLGIIIGSINQSADVLGQSSETAIRVMEKTLGNVQQQRDETEMVATAMQEMGTATAHVAENTAEAARVAEDAKARVSDGRKAAVDTQSIIKQLTDEINNASDVIESLAAETDNIGTVLEAISGIAEQTNLLALNAAIEAARAGDTGRGFAVVADEVRTLAQRTQTSTEDIRKLVESLQTEAKNAVTSMEKGVSSTSICLQKGTEMATALEDASQAVNEISDLNARIASTAEEQSAASAQINTSVENISRIAEETSNGSSETATANQNIARSIIDLHTNLNQFQV